MENTPLNQGHEAGRRAVKLVRKGRLREAAETHLLAATILQKLELELEQDSLCKRSLEEQVKFHRRQAELAKVLRELVETGYKLQKMAEKPPPPPSEKRKILQPTFNSNSNRPGYRHPDIIRQLDDADSLLQILSYRTSNGSNPQGQGQTQAMLQEVNMMNQSPPVEFTIRPKNDTEVIEELQTVNFNLRALVDKLLTELEECRAENRELRRSLAVYKGVGAETDVEVGVGDTATATASLPSHSHLSSPSKDKKYYEDDPQTQTQVETLALGKQSTGNFEIPELDPLEIPIPDCDLSEFNEFNSHYSGNY